MKRGFTLAEILITLSIIGVIASMTIPSLVQDVQDAQLKTAWRKAYTDICQASKRLAMDNGGNLSGIFPSTDIDSKLRDSFLKYFSYTKACNTSVEGCWHPLKGSYPAFKYLNGNYQQSYGSSSTAILSNGNLVQFVESANMGVGRIVIDINGYKGPNILGKDIFHVFIQKDGTVKPDGYQGSGRENDCNINPPSGYGWGCSSQYLYK